MAIAHENELPLPIEPEKQEPTLWDRWTIIDGTYTPPDPNRFKFFAENIPLGDAPQMAKATVRYALERAGLLLSPEELNEPLERLRTASPKERVQIVDSFLEYCDLADQVWEKIEEASDLTSQYSFDQIRIGLPEVTKGSEDLAAMKIVKAMHKSKDEAFSRIGSVTKSHSSAIIRILYGWGKGAELPKPGEHLNSVS